MTKCELCQDFEREAHERDLIGFITIPLCWECLTLIARKQRELPSWIPYAWRWSRSEYDEGRQMEDEEREVRETELRDALLGVSSDTMNMIRELQVTDGNK